MGHNAAPSDCALGIVVVVTLVEAEVFGTTRSARCADDHAVEHVANHPLVVHVRGGDAHREWHAAAVGQDVALDPAFRAIRGIRARVVPPFGAFTEALSSDVHFH